MSSMATENPQTGSGLGGAAQIAAPATDDPNFAVAPVNAIGIPQGLGLPPQLGLPSTNAASNGAFTDAQYLGQDAALRAQIGQQYAQILQQLGYMDPNSGNVIPGTVVQDANIQLAQYLQGEQQALQGVVQNAQNNGTLFSGIRQTQTAQAESPFQQNMAQLNLTTGQSLQDLYNQAQNLLTSYNTSNQQNLADAAARNLQQIQANALLAASQGGGGSAPSSPTPSDSQPSSVAAAQQQLAATHPLAGGSFNLSESQGLPQTPLAGGSFTLQSPGFGAAAPNTVSAIANAAHAAAAHPNNYSSNLGQGVYATH